MGFECVYQLENWSTFSSSVVSNFADFDDD